MSLYAYEISSDKKMNGRPLGMTMETPYSGGNLGGYTLTESEKLQVLALNELHNVGHLVRERNENPRSSGGRHE